MKELYIYNSRLYNRGTLPMVLYCVYDTKWVGKKGGFFVNEVGYAHEFVIENNKIDFIRDAEINYDALQNSDDYEPVSTTKAIQLIFEFEVKK